MRKLLLLPLIFCLVASARPAQQSKIEIPQNTQPPKFDPGNLHMAVTKLNIVVAKNDIGCLFQSNCKIDILLPDNQVLSKIAVNGTKGTGTLQSTSTKCESNSPAAGMYVYQYTVKLTDWQANSGKAPTFTSFTINFGPIVDTLDFNGDGKKGDQVFVSKNGLGTIVPSEAIYDGTSITFKFNNPTLSGGGAFSKGQSTFFFGLVSKHPPRTVGVRAVVNESTGINLSARAPNF
jgi:hypothetical protein